MKKKWNPLWCRKNCFFFVLHFFLNRSDLLVIVIMLPFAIRMNISQIALCAHEYQGRSGNKSNDGIERVQWIPIMIFPLKSQVWINRKFTKHTHTNSVYKCCMDWAFLLFYYTAAAIYLTLETSETLFFFKVMRKKTIAVNIIWNHYQNQTRLSHVN